MAYLIFWGPLFMVTLFNWDWDYEEAKQSMAHEVTLHVAFVHAFVNPSLLMVLHRRIRQVCVISLLSRSRLSPVQFFQLRLDWTATKTLYRAVHCSVHFSVWFMIIDSWTLYLHHWQLWFVFNLNWRLKQFFDLGWNWSDLLFLEETLQTQKKCQVSNWFNIEILNKLLATIFGDMLHSLWTYVDHHYSG